MARALTTDHARAPEAAGLPGGPTDRTAVVRLPIDSVPVPLASALEPAIVACEAAIAFRVRQGTRPPGGGLLTALVDAVEVGQTTLDLARRQSPLLPAARDLARLAFARAESACRERGDDPLVACADTLRETAGRLRDGS